MTSFWNCSTCSKIFGEQWSAYSFPAQNLSQIIWYFWVRSTSAEERIADVVQAVRVLTSFFAFSFHFYTSILFSHENEFPENSVIYNLQPKSSGKQRDDADVALAWNCPLGSKISNKPSSARFWHKPITDHGTYGLLYKQKRTNSQCRWKGDSVFEKFWLFISIFTIVL